MCGVITEEQARQFQNIQGGHYRSKLPPQPSQASGSSIPSDDESLAIIESIGKADNQQIENRMREPESYLPRSRTAEQQRLEDEIINRRLDETDQRARDLLSSHRQRGGRNRTKA